MNRNELIQTYLILNRSDRNSSQQSGYQYALHYLLHIFMFEPKYDFTRKNITHIPWKLRLTVIPSRSPFHERSFHRNANAMEFPFCCHSSCGIVIAMKFCTWHDDWTVVTCTTLIISTISHCLGLGHETLVSAVCLSIFLQNIVVIYLRIGLHYNQFSIEFKLW